MNKQIKWGIILQYVQMAISIVIQLLYTPIMINILGDNEYGLYSLVSSIISYLNLLSLGFTASYIRYYSKYKAQKNEDGLNKLNGLFLTIFSILGLIALLCGILISLNPSMFFNSSYSLSDINLAKKLLLLLSFNLAISFPASVFISYISAHEQFIFQKLINIGKTILGPILSVVLLFHNYGSIGIVFVTTIVSVFVDIINVIFCLKKLHMKFSFGKWENGLFKDIATFSIFIAINQIVDQINWQTDKIILGKIINSSAVAIYSVASTINILYMSFSVSISSVFTPLVNKIEATEESIETKSLKNTDLFIKVGRIQFFVIMLIMTGFIFWGKQFILLWVGENYSLAYYITLLLICPVAIPLIQNLGIEIQRAQNKHQFRSFLYLIMAILNVLISILFCKLWGIIGVALGTSISLILCNVIIMNIYYHKIVKIDMIKFWISILKIIPAFIIPTLFAILIMKFVIVKNFLDLLIIVSIYSLIYFVSIYLFGLNKEEKSFIHSFIKKTTKEKNFD